MYSLYKIQPDDTLDSIAQNNNISIDEIKKINGLVDNSMPYVGGYLLIPTKDENSNINSDNMSINSNYKKYTVKKGDNMYQIARDNNVNYSLLLAVNGLNDNDYIYPDQEILIPNPNMKFYLTKEGDTLGYLYQNIPDVMSVNPNLYIVPDQIVFYN